MASDVFYCSEISYITIPETVEYVEYNAFRSCNDLKRVFVCNKQTEFEYGAFRSCPNVLLICPQGSYADYFASNTVSHI